MNIPSTPKPEGCKSDECKFRGRECTFCSSLPQREKWLEDIKDSPCRLCYDQDCIFCSLFKANGNRKVI